MSLTIDRESRQRKLLPIDIDFMTDTYKTTSGVFTFPSPSLWTIEKNIFYLLRDSVQKTFERKYAMRPDYLSFDEYGTVALAQLLMYVNNVSCVEDFDLDTVIVPTFDTVVDICKDKFPRKKNEDMTEVDW